MPELDLEAVQITNPASTDFTWRYNGTPYTIAAGTSKSFAKPVSYHLAKHLSSEMVIKEAWEGLSKKEKEIALASPNHKIHTKISQLQAYDTHERRIALYKIFSGTEHVLEVIKRYPFKGFIGDMHVYEEFVQAQEKPKEPETNAEEKTTPPAEEKPKDPTAKQE